MRTRPGAGSGSGTSLISTASGPVRAVMTAARTRSLHSGSDKWRQPWRRPLDGLSVGTGGRSVEPAISDWGQPDIGVARALADPPILDESRVSNRYDDMDVPTLNFAGWYDIFLQGSLDNYVGMRSRGRTARLVVGPWAHTTLVSAFGADSVGEQSFGLASVLPGGRTVTDVHLGW